LLLAYIVKDIITLCLYLQPGRGTAGRGSHSSDSHSFGGFGSGGYGSGGASPEFVGSTGTSSLYPSSYLSGSSGYRGDPSSSLSSFLHNTGSLSGKEVVNETSSLNLKPSSLSGRASGGASDDTPTGLKDEECLICIDKLDRPQALPTSKSNLCPVRREGKQP